MMSAQSAWQQIHQILYPQGKSLSPQTLLCHIFLFPDPVFWVTRGVKVLGDILHSNALLTFEELKSHFDLSNSYLFSHLQLPYAFMAQSGWSEILQISLCLKSQSALASITSIS